MSVRPKINPGDASFLVSLRTPPLNMAFVRGIDSGHPAAAGLSRLLLLGGRLRRWGLLGGLRLRLRFFDRRLRMRFGDWRFFRDGFCLRALLRVR